MTAKRVLFVCAAILFVIAALIGFDWIGPDNPQDASQWYFGLLASGGAALALGHAA